LPVFSEMSGETMSDADSTFAEVVTPVKATLVAKLARAKHARKGPAKAPHPHMISP
jgi:hypothetical protein